MPMLRMFQGHRKTANAAEKAAEEIQRYEQELKKHLQMRLNK